MTYPRSGDVDTVKFLLKVVTDDGSRIRDVLTQTDVHGRTALMLAVKTGENGKFPKQNQSIVGELLACCEPAVQQDLVEIKDDYGRRAFDYIPVSVAALYPLVENGS